MRALRLAGCVAWSTIAFGVVLLFIVVLCKSRGIEPPRWTFWTTLALSVVVAVGGIYRAFADHPDMGTPLAWSFLLLVPLVVVGDLVLTFMIGCTWMGPCM
jgi:hypothetical protein